MSTSYACRGLIVVLCLLPRVEVFAEEARTRASGMADPLFADERTLELRLEGPIEAIAADRAADPRERDVRMVWRDAQGVEQSLGIEVRARGRSRRDPARCPFPPLRLDIPRGKAAGTLFAQQDKIKLVSHCRPLGSRARGARDWLLREYLAYRILSVLTEHAFRVRLLDVVYVTEQGREYRHPAFLIEAAERLAVRTGLAVEDVDRAEETRFDDAATQLADLFQYAIGNTDYSFLTGPSGERCCHNAVLLADPMRGALVPVPYDFDVAGIVDRPGAIPAPGLGTRYVTERVYLGRCRDAASGRLAAQRILEVWPVIESEIAALDGLSASAALAVTDFLAEFHSELADPERLDDLLSERCRN